jgi:hypothetical protein
LRLSKFRLGDVGDVEVFDWAFAILDVFMHLATSTCGNMSMLYIPTARIVSLIVVM